MLGKVKSITHTEEKKRLLGNFLSLSILQVFTYILPLLTLPYLVRVLGVEKYGLVMFAQSFIMFFYIFVDYGFNLSATREVSVHRDNKDKITEIFSSVMMIKFILVVISFILLSTIIFSFEKFSSNWELYYLTFLYVVGQAMFPIWYFQGMERMKYITIINITSKLLFTILIFVVVQSSDDYIYVPILNGFGFIVSGTVSLYIVRKNFHQKFQFQSIQTMLAYFKDSSQFFLSRVSVSIYTSANTFVLGLMTTETIVGYYSIAEKLYIAVQSFYGPIVQALYPHVAKKKNIKLFKKIFYFTVILNIIAVVFLYIFGEYIFSFLFTQDVGKESIKVFHILLIANIIVVPSILIGYPFLGALGFAKYANISVIYASVVHLIGLGILILTNSINIYNIAFMVIITQLVDFMYRLYGLNKERLWNLTKEVDN